jgi:hypothetical protein
MYTYNPYDKIYWFDTTAQLASDAVIVKSKTAKAATLDAPFDVYISNGTSWIKIADGSTLAYYILTLNQGENTTITVVDSKGNVYTNGSRVQAGATLTITAAADDGYNLSVYTVGGVDKTGDNPTTHIMSADVTVVTEATEA